MHTTIRLAAGIITAVVATAALAEPGASNAALTVISPGDQVDYITSTTTQFCTIGYAYSGPDFSKGCTSNSAAREHDGCDRHRHLRLVINSESTPQLSNTESVPKSVPKPARFSPMSSNVRWRMEWVLSCDNATLSVHQRTHLTSLGSSARTRLPRPLR
jgi:hypothetical protein